MDNKNTSLLEKFYNALNERMERINRGDSRGLGQKLLFIAILSTLFLPIFWFLAHFNILYGGDLLEYFLNILPQIYKKLITYYYPDFFEHPFFIDFWKELSTQIFIFLGTYVFTGSLENAGRAGDYALYIIPIERNWNLFFYEYKYGIILREMIIMALRMYLILFSIYFIYFIFIIIPYYTIGIFLSVVALIYFREVFQEIYDLKEKVRLLEAEIKRLKR